MKKFTCITLMLLLPLIGFAQEAKKEGPKKETISSYRVLAKDGHDAALKAALAAHAQKFHTGNWKWRVSEVLSGPDMGAYMIVEGPNSWTDLEGRGDLGPDHQKDYDTNILPHVDRSTPEIYGVYQADLSTVTAGAFSPTKTLISRVFIKPGRNSHYANALKTWKKVWEKRDTNVGVWVTFFSGEPSYLLVYRLKNGWKDLDEDIISMRKAADEIGGAGTYDRLMEENAADIERSVGEMISFKPELSSK
jgi:hypothetical protein